LLNNRTHGTGILQLAWAMSSWTKATLLLKATPPPFRFMTEDEKRYFACYHLLIAWTSLRHLRTPRIVRVINSTLLLFTIECCAGFAHRSRRAPLPRCSCRIVL